MSKKGNKVANEIREHVNATFDKELTYDQMIEVLHYMDIQWQRLRPGYYRGMHFKEKLVKRREKLCPLLHRLFHHEHIIVWNYDQVRPNVNDTDKYGWVDNTVDWHDQPQFVGTDRQKGVSISVGGFLSAEFGLLYRDDGTHVGTAMTKAASTAKSVKKEFEEAARLVSSRWPEYLHVFFTDSGQVHAAMDPGFANPNNINLKDGGKNRIRDDMFGTLGLNSIWKKHWRDEDIRGKKVDELRAMLWDKPMIHNQKFPLERICEESGVLFLFNVQGHPHLAPIERLWRDGRYDYRHNKPKTQKELVGHWEGWMDDGEIDETWAASYFAPTLAFVQYYMRGGKKRLTTRQVMKMEKAGFDLDCGDVNVSDATMLKRQTHLKDKIPLLFQPWGTFTREDLFKQLFDYFHSLNWKRKREVEDADGEDV